MSQGKPKVNHLTDSERAIVADICKCRDDLVWTDARFHRRFLHAYSYSTWIRVRNDQWTGDTRAVLDYYARQLPAIRAFLLKDNAERPNIRSDEQYHITRDARAVLSAVDIARRRRDEKGLVMWVADPGGGKSALLRYLRREHGARLTQATRAWMRSYCSGLQAVGQALGVSETFRSTHYLEQAVFQAARELGHGILGIDDANTFGPHTCDMIRDLCNLTNLTIVTASTAIPFNRPNRLGYQEGEQMRRRAVAIVKADKISPEDVAPFLRPLQLNGALDAACVALADRANLYNKYDFINSVVRGLRLRASDCAVTGADVAKVIEVEEKKLQRK